MWRWAVLVVPFSVCVCLSQAVLADTALAEEAYLWLDVGVSVKQPDGCVRLPLGIRVGGADSHRSLDGVHGLQVFLAEGSQKDGARYGFRDVPIQRNGGQCSVVLVANRAQSFTILARGVGTWKDQTNVLTAEARLILFGHGSKSADRAPLCIPYDDIRPRCEIAVEPPFSYWRQTGQPITVSVLSTNTIDRARTLWIVDENLGTTNVVVSVGGRTTYVPPRDRRLDRTGETASKQVVLVAKERVGDTNHITSRTLIMHRSRSGNRDSVLGRSVFLVAGMSVWLTVVRLRRRALS